MKFLVTDHIHEKAKELLSEQELVFKSIDNVEDNDFDGIILRTFTKLSKKDVEKFPELEYVISCSVGLDNIDKETLEKKGIELISCSGTNANSVAEHALYLLMMCHRNVSKKNNLFSEVKGKTIGFIGFGKVGQEFAKKLKGLQVDIIVYDVVKFGEQELKKFNAKQTNLEYLIKNSDIISVHVPLLESTKDLIDEKLFEKMKKGVMLINTSRAGVIDEIAFLKNVKNNTISRAGLDVYSNELYKKLKNNNKIIFTPHVGAKGEKSFKNMCVKPVKKFLKKINS